MSSSSGSPGSSPASSRILSATAAPSRTSQIADPNTTGSPSSVKKLGSALRLGGMNRISSSARRRNVIASACSSTSSTGDPASRASSARSSGSSHGSNDRVGPHKLGGSPAMTRASRMSQRTASRETCGLLTSMRVAAEEILQRERATRLDREHPVEAEPRGGDPRRRLPLGRRQRPHGRRSAPPVCHRPQARGPGGTTWRRSGRRRRPSRARADELLERSADRVVELISPPSPESGGRRRRRAAPRARPLLVGETATLVLAPAAARARRVPRDRRAAHARSP